MHVLVVLSLWMPSLRVLRKTVWDTCMQDIRTYCKIHMLAKSIQCLPILCTPIQILFMEGAAPQSQPPSKPQGVLGLVFFASCSSLRFFASPILFYVPFSFVAASHVYGVCVLLTSILFLPLSPCRCALHSMQKGRKREETLTF
jgi:hypothetical protein